MEETDHISIWCNKIFHIIHPHSFFLYGSQSHYDINVLKLLNKDYIKKLLIDWEKYIDGPNTWGGSHSFYKAQISIIKDNYEHWLDEITIKQIIT